MGAQTTAANAYEWRVSAKFRKYTQMYAAYLFRKKMGLIYMVQKLDILGKQHYQY